MARFVFKCKTCGTRMEVGGREAPGFCSSCGSFGGMVRDWQAEGVGVAVQNLKNERNAGGSEAMKRLFLPHNDDFKGPGDPDGTKGMREWRENNQPRPTNKNPDWPGYVEKKVF